jgi:Leucine-rich repeat (LRR) protein
VFEGLPNLQELNLYSNQISEIRLPAKLMCLAKLKHLDIGDNDFVSLPKRISQLPSLKSIGLCLNLLTEVPVELCNESFHFIVVSKNAGPNAHASTCERGLLAMMRCWKGTGHDSAVKEGHNGFCKRKRAVQASISFSPMISKKATRGLFIANSDDDTVREEEDPVSKAFHEKYQRTPRCQSLLLRK